MSLLAEVAARADVPVEGVVRVVTRQPVSRRIEQRVVDVLDSLEPEQLRALERLARAGMPEIVDEGAEFKPKPEPMPVPAREPPASVGSTPPSGSAEALALQLGSLLEEVSARLNELRREQLAGRQERVDDLAVLVDLMTTGWRGVDRRLGRIERTLARLESAREAPAPQRLVVSPRELQQPVEDVAAPAEPVEAPTAEPPTEPPTAAWRRALALATPLLIVAGVALALVAFEFAAPSDDDPQLQPATSNRRAAPPTSLSSTTGGPAPTTTAQPPTPATLAGTVTTQPGAEGGALVRIFSWTAKPRTPYYLVRIFRGTTLVHQARPRQARLVVPASLTFTPDTYRWTVHPGIGAPAQNRFGAPLVDSAFIVSG